MARRMTSPAPEAQTHARVPSAPVPVAIRNQALVGGLQRALRVGRSGDRFEREAESVADAVMRMPQPDVQRCPGGCPGEEELQRQPLEEEEELLQPAAADEIAQRQPLEEDEEEGLQRHPIGREEELVVPSGEDEALARQVGEEEPDEELQAQRSTGGVRLGAATTGAINAARGSGSMLPAEERSFFEPRFGRRFDDVRVHADRQAAELAARVSARAFTVGRDVFFGEGEWSPGTSRGRHLLAHELTHTIQQGKDDVRRTRLPGGAEAGRRITTVLVQRQDEARQPAIYGAAAAQSTALPGSVLRQWNRRIASGETSAALAAVVDEMRRRGEITERLLTSDAAAGELWVIREISPLAASVTFRSAIPDPADATRRLPNPRFAVDPGMFRVGRPALLDLHMALLHEFRHLQQRAETLNRPPAGGPPVIGYCNQPEEFDAYLSEIEAAYDNGVLRSRGIQAAVIWPRLTAAERGVFGPRWQAAQTKITTRLHTTVDDLRTSSTGQRFAAQCDRLRAAARAAWERAQRRVEEGSASGGR